MATAPREWPNNQKEARDQAAERVNSAHVRLNSLLDGRPHEERDVILVAAQVKEDLANALRWLERAGACTTPKVLGAYGRDRNLSH